MTLFTMSRNISASPHRQLICLKNGGDDTQVLYVTIASPSTPDLPTENTDRYIAVPGVSTPRPDRWHPHGASESWLTSIRCDSAENVGVYYFNNELWSEDELSWGSVAHQGDAFLDALRDLTEREEVSCATLTSSMPMLKCHTATYLSHHIIFTQLRRS